MSSSSSSTKAVRYISINSYDNTGRALRCRCATSDAALRVEYLLQQSNGARIFHLLCLWVDGAFDNNVGINAEQTVEFVRQQIPLDERRNWRFVHNIELLAPLPASSDENVLFVDGRIPRRLLDAVAPHPPGLLPPPLFGTYWTLKSSLI